VAPEWARGTRIGKLSGSALNILFKDINNDVENIIINTPHMTEQLEQT
jgi:hypothetical protein